MEEPDLDILGLLDKLDDLIHNAKGIPLTDQVRVDRGEIFAVLDEMRARIPEQIKEARWIVRERDMILDDARADAARMTSYQEGRPPGSTP
jgi:hypothetical protein